MYVVCPLCSNPHFLHIFLVRVVKGDLILEGMYFHFGPILEKMCELTIRQLELKVKKRDNVSDFGHFLEDGTKSRRL